MRITALIVILFVGCKDQHQVDYQHSFGQVFIEQMEIKDWTLNHDFKVTNSTSEIMELEVESTTCGCASCEILNTRLNPGETTSVIPKIDLSFERRGRSESVVLSTGSSAAPKLSFTLEAEVFPRVTIHPYQRDIFISCDNDGSESINLLVIGYEPIAFQEINELLIESPNVLLIEKERSTVDEFPGIRRITVPVRINMAPHVSIGPGDKVGGKVLFKLGRYAVSTNVVFLKDKLFIASPEKLFVNARSSENSSEVRITSRVPFSIRDVNFDNPLLDVETTQVNKNLVIAKLRFNRNGRLHTSARSVISFATDNPLQRLRKDQVGIDG